jgi:mono/diheme cytochrome c family protein
VGVDGKEIYLAKCKSCHGVDGKGDTSVGKKIRDAGGDFPSLAGTKLAKAKIVEIVEDGVPDTKMKPYKEKLSAEQIDAVAGYVKKL